MAYSRRRGRKGGEYADEVHCKLDGRTWLCTVRTRYEINPRREGKYYHTGTGATVAAAYKNALRRYRKNAA